MIPTIEWSGKYIRMIDQRKIPRKLEWYTCRNYVQVINAIEKMVIRGAPAIGVAAAMGLALGAESIKAHSYDDFKRNFKKIADKMIKARPTAVNLGWAVERMSQLVDKAPNTPLDILKKKLRVEADNILREDIEINRQMGQYGQGLIPGKGTVLTHCNAGALATAGYGTALGVIRAAREKGKNVRVIADETRPWLQGLRLTAFELMQDHIPVSVIADNAAGSLMRQKVIDLVITGADRIAANGDVANKIGTYQVAVLARENRIPFYVAAPLSTIDPQKKTGDMIPIEERDPEEIFRFENKQIGPKGIKAINPAFDITPNKYISAIITEKGILRPPFKKKIRELFHSR